MSARTPDRAGRGHPNGDRGGIVLGWLLRVTLVLVVTAVIAFDGISVGLAKIGATDDATAAATAASEAWQSSPRDPTTALHAASATATAHGEQVLPGMTIAADGTVELRLRRVANTILLQRVPPLARFGQVVAVGSARSTSSS